MISRFIEAKPDELRVFLEEAAAISKYKERRKETEQRLDKTRENLDQIDDIRGELAKQLICSVWRILMLLISSNVRLI